MITKIQPTKEQISKLWQLLYDKEENAVLTILNMYNIPMDIEEPNQDSSLLCYAALHNLSKVVKYLIDNGADIQGYYDHDQRPLTMAAHFGSLECVKLLVEAGANINAISTQNNTPLSHCMGQYDLKVAKYLIDNGANVNQLCDVGFTCLYAAYIKNNAEMMDLLLDNGADPYIEINSSLHHKHCNLGKTTIIELIIIPWEVRKSYPEMMAVRERLLAMKDKQK